MKPIRWGILSTGNMARQFAEDFRHSVGGTLAAVCSRDAVRGRAFADYFDIPHVYDSLAGMLAGRRFDVLYIATPHSDHFHAALAAIEQGYHVVCEKPMTLSFAHTRKLYQAAAKAGVFVMEALWTRFNPVIQQMLRLTAAGAIGEIKGVQADFGFHIDVTPDHRLVNPELGGGALLDVGIYPLFLAQLVLGVPEVIESRVELGETGVDLHEDIWLEFESGAMANLTASFNRYLPNQAVISGTRGYIRISGNWFEARSLYLSRAGHPVEEMVMDYPGKGWHLEVTHVNDCLRRGLIVSDLHSPQDSMALARTMDILLEQWECLEQRA